MNGKPTLTSISVAPYAEGKVALFAVDTTGRVWRMLDALGPLGSTNPEERRNWEYLPLTPRSPESKVEAGRPVVNQPRYVPGPRGNWSDDRERW